MASLPLGRDELLARIERTLDDGTSVVTLVGPPGIGKTRVATELARRHGSRRIFELTSLREGDPWERVAVGAGFVPRGRDALLAKLAEDDPDALWVLDGVDEQAATIGAIVASLALAAPRLRLVTTSRSHLEIAAPIEWARVEVGPLDEDAAIALLERRARARGGLVGDGPLALAGELVRAVDHVPLGIELLAAQLRTVAPPEALRRLREGGVDDGPLAAAFTGIVETLPLPTRRTAAALAVFRGGFSLEAAAAVADTPIEELNEHLRELLDASLIIARAVDEVARFDMMEVVARTLGRLDPETRAHAALRHRDWFAAWALRGIVALEEADVDAGHAALELDEDNLHRAAETARDTEAWDEATALALALDAIREGRGVETTEASVLEVAVPSVRDSELSARGWAALGEARRREARLAGALDAFERARTGSDRAAALAERGLGLIAWMRGDLREARDRHRHADELARASGAAALAARMRAGHAAVEIMLGRFEEARAELLEALETLDRLGHRRAAQLVRANLGSLAHQRRQLAEADALFTLVIDGLEADGDAVGAAQFRVNRALLSLERGASSSAERDLERAARVFEKSGRRRERALVDRTWAILEEVRGGSLAEAQTRVESAARALEEMRDPRNAALARAQSAWLAARRGRTDAARDHAEIAETLLDEIDDAAVCAGVLRWLEGTRALLEPTRASPSPPDPEGVEARLAVRVVDAARPVGAARVTLARDGRWFRDAAGHKTSLEHRPTLARVLAALVSHEDAGLDLDALLAAGWPGESVQPKAGRARVYVAISTLRKLGLEGVVARTDAGYALSPGTFVIAAEDLEG
ncbi:MAG: hypothetical protein R3B82_04615 [Sandaracinaceae bacterium]